MLKRFIVLFVAVAACSPKASRSLPDWILQPDTAAVALHGYGVSLSTSDTAEATRQARVMASAMLALGREMRVSSIQTMREDSAGSVMEASARFISSIPASLAPVSKIERLKGNVTVVRVDDVPAKPDEETIPVELSWFNLENQQGEETALVLTVGQDRWEWKRSNDVISFVPVQPQGKANTALDATDWKEKLMIRQGWETAMGSAEFTNQPGSFALAFLGAYAHAVSHLSHSIQSNMVGSAQMFSKNRSNADVKTTSNTVLPGVHFLGASVLATASGTLLLEIHTGTRRQPGL
jgi:hypothetical protein